MTYAHTHRILATVLAASCIAVPASASASGGPASSDRTDAAQAGATAGFGSTDRTDAAQAGATAGFASSDRTDAAQSYTTALIVSSDRTDAAHSGSTALLPSTPSTAESTFPAANFRGDSPVDHPGASRAPTSAPTTIEIVRPVRTIVRDVNEVLPLILSSTALLLVLVGLGLMLVRTRIVPRVGPIR